jgi:hypothetical protein
MKNKSNGYGRKVIYEEIFVKYGAVIMEQSLDEADSKKIAKANTKSIAG